MFRAVLFDLDGVLVDSYETWFQVLCAVAERQGYPPVERDAFAAGWGQGIAADVKRFFPRHRVAELERLYEEEYPRQLAHLRFDPQAPAVLAALRARGLPSALVTNTPGPLARAVLARGGLALDHVVGGTDVPRGKPAPDMLLLACEQVGVEPARALMLGDTEYDRAAAEAAGVPFAGLRFGAGRRIERLEDLLGLIADAA